MKNTDKFLDIIEQVKTLSQRKQREFLLLTLGSMKVNFEHRSVNEKSVIESYLMALEVTKKN